MNRSTKLHGNRKNRHHRMLMTILLFVGQIEKMNVALVGTLSVREQLKMGVTMEAPLVAAVRDSLT